MAAGLIAAAQEAPIEARARALRDLERSAADDSARVKQTAAAQERQREFVTRLADFANCWNQLMRTADKGVWNAKIASKTHKAFERLVEAEGWIEETH